MTGPSIQSTTGPSVSGPLISEASLVPTIPIISTGTRRQPSTIFAGPTWAFLLGTPARCAGCSPGEDPVRRYYLTGGQRNRGFHLPAHASARRRGLRTAVRARHAVGRSGRRRVRSAVDDRRRTAGHAGNGGAPAAVRTGPRPQRPRGGADGHVAVGLRARRLGDVPRHRHGPLRRTGRGVGLALPLTRHGSGADRQVPTAPGPGRGRSGHAALPRRPARPTRG